MEQVQVNQCACQNCAGVSCACGCQDVRAVQACACGAQCQCGERCACGDQKTAWRG